MEICLCSAGQGQQTDVRDSSSDSPSGAVRPWLENAVAAVAGDVRGPVEVQALYRHELHGGAVPHHLCLHF